MYCISQLYNSTLNCLSFPLPFFLLLLPSLPLFLSLFLPITLSLSSHCTGTTSSIRCRCDQSVSLGLPSASCAIHNFTCTSPRGCYVRRWYSNHLNTIVQVWGCISDEHGVHNQIDYTSLFCGLLNNRTDAYQCCNTTDFCSDDLQIVLPMEMESPSPSPVASAPAHTGEMSTYM